MACSTVISRDLNCHSGKSCASLAIVALMIEVGYTSLVDIQLIGACCMGRRCRVLQGVLDDAGGGESLQRLATEVCAAVHNLSPGA